MAERFSWVDTGLQAYRIVSEAQSWDELHPALVAGWIQFATVLGTCVEADLRAEVDIAFFASSGRLVFNHAKRKFPAALDWTKIPTDYIWSVSVHCDWVEMQWEEEPSATGVGLALACLNAASDERVAGSFQAVGLGDLPVRGAGVTQSPAPFETKLGALFRGSVPTVFPAG